MMQMVNI